LIKKFNTLAENQRRWCAVAKANELGRGGVSKVINVTGPCRNTTKKEWSNGALLVNWHQAAQLEASAEEESQKLN
jgi:hypothetical protein